VCFTFAGCLIDFFAGVENSDLILPIVVVVVVVVVAIVIDMLCGPARCTRHSLIEPY